MGTGALLDPGASRRVATASPHIARIVLLATVGLAASVASANAGDNHARTPAEIEIRKAEIAARLADIEREGAGIAAWCAELPAALAVTDVAWAALDWQCQAFAAHRGPLAEEKATLEREQATLANARTRNATGPQQPADPRGMTPLDLAGQSGQVTSGQAFNPSISVIPDIAYYNDNRQGAASAMLAGADGFGHAHAQDDADVHSHSSLERGFNLREVELAFSGAVDPYFDVWTTFAVGPDGLDTEEAYVQTRKFLPGVQLRVGKFFSGVGYINKQHPHQWEFVDQSLPYDAILGGNLCEVGLQVTWLPNLPVYTLLGFEALQGDNERIAQQLSDLYPGVFEESAGPRLFTGFLKVSPDTGYSNAVQGGVSFGHSRSHQEVTSNEEGLLEEALDGTSWFVGSDWVWRHDSPRPFGRGDLTVQGEYLYRRKDLLDVTRDDVLAAAGGHHVSAQDGVYAQAVYGIAQRWTLGGRLDVVGLTNRVETPGDTTDYESSRRYSAALTFNPTEFSRLRVQYDAGAVWLGERTTFHQVFVQFQMSLGTHGAHRF